MINNKLRLSELAPFVNLNYEISEAELPYEVFLRVVKPKQTGWRYIGQLSFDDNSLEFWTSDEVMQIIYELAEFSPEVAYQYGLRVPWLVEYGFFKEKYSRNRPKGTPVRRFQVYLYKPEITVMFENENIPEAMKPYLLKQPQQKEEKKEERGGGIEDILSKIDTKTLLALIQAGLINLEQLKSFIQPQAQVKQPEPEKKVIKDEDSIINEIIQQAKAQPVIREEPRDKDKDLITTLREGFEFVKQLPDVANALKDLLNTLGISGGGNVAEAVQKQQKALSMLLEDYAKLKQEVKKLKEEKQENLIELIEKGGEHESSGQSD